VKIKALESVGIGTQRRASVLFIAAKFFSTVVAKLKSRTDLRLLYTY
jgi:hypothetical protein